MRRYACTISPQRLIWQRLIRRRLIRRRLVRRGLLIAVLLCFASNGASAALYSGELLTLVRHSKRPWYRDRDSNVTTLYERLHFRVYDIGMRNLSLHGGGWFKYDFQEEYLDSEDLDGDLKHLYLDYVTKERSLHLRAGRQWVSEGVGVAQLDGVLMTFVLPAGVGATVYGGRPVEYGEIEDSDGDLFTGGRLFYRLPWWRAEVGLSGNIGRDDGEPAEERVGIDWALHPARWVDISGYAFYDTLAEAWMDERIDLVVRPTDRLHLDFTYQHVIPSFYLAKTSIFWVFSDTEQERYTGGVGYDLTDRMSVYADYSHVTYDQSGRVDDAFFPNELEDFEAPDETGYDTGLQFKYRFGRTRPNVASIEVRYQKGPDEEIFDPVEDLRDETSPDDLFHEGSTFTSVRGYVLYYVLGNLFLTFDTSHTIYEDDVSHFASVGADYKLDGRWQFSGNVGYGSTPYVEDDFRVTFKVVRRFGGRW